MTHLSESFCRLEEVLRSDPQGRKIDAFFRAGELEAAAKSLRQGTEVGLVTGFYITSAEALETDGPPGTLALAEGLTRIGIEATLIVDEAGEEFFRRAEVAPLQRYRPAARLDPFPSHLVAIERPGRARDGKYYSMRGAELSSRVEPLDALFLGGGGADSIVTIGIGDGGNEVGMGSVREEIIRHIPHGDVIATIVAADLLVVAGTSNWGAWGLLAGLSLLAGQSLLPTMEQATEHLTRAVSAGAVDGISGQSTITVDGLELEAYLAPLESLSRIVAEGLAASS